LKALATAVCLFVMACATAHPSAPARPAAAAAGAPGAATAAAAPAAPPEDPAEAARLWHPLTRTDKSAEARALCEPWLASPSSRLAAEGHKCMANVALIGSKKVHVEPGGKQGAFLGAAYAGPGVDQAIEHLNKAAALAPDDLSIHEGRLHVAINSQRNADAPKFLAETLQSYTGPDALGDWLSYSQELWDMGYVEIGLGFMRVLEKRYPNDHRVVGNVGTFLVVLDHRDEALPYLRRAVDLAPGDAIDNWNLGRFYEKQGDSKNAEPYFRKAVASEKDPERHQDMACNLARFLAAQTASRTEGCTLARKQCDVRPPTCARPAPADRTARGTTGPVGP
jgi:tetratricopeptide (TPR) repeat protein